MNIAVIPARGGSKRIPRKNIRPFAGKPMIAWPIVAALESGLFARVIVSTDDEEISEAAREAGAEVPFIRPAELSDDYATTSDVMVHALRWARDEGIAVDAACCIYATAALVSVEDLRSAQALLAQDCDYVFAAVRYGHPPQRGFLRRDNGSPALMAPEHAKTRTQDLPPVYHDAGQFYWGQRAAWESGAAIFGPRSRFIELPALRAQDIDNEEDWQLAEAAFGLSRR